MTGAHYLVRHGRAEPATSGMHDAFRSLDERGRAEVLRVARSAAAAGVRLVEIRHSGMLRARQTAEILARHLAPPQGIRAVEGLAPGDDPAIARAELEAAREPVMLVGHLPHLGRLASALLVGDPARAVVRLRPGAMACLAADKAGWELHWLLSPELVMPERLRERR